MEHGLRPELLGQKVYLEDIQYDDDDEESYDGMFTIGGYIHYSCGCYYVLVSEDGRQIDGDVQWINGEYDDQRQHR